MLSLSDAQKENEEENGESDRIHALCCFILDELSHDLIDQRSKPFPNIFDIDAGKNEGKHIASCEQNQKMEPSISWGLLHMSNWTPCAKGSSVLQFRVQVCRLM